jgi:hypothetical protein
MNHEEHEEHEDQKRIAILRAESNLPQALEALMKKSLAQQLKCIDILDQAFLKAYMNPLCVMN